VVVRRREAAEAAAEVADDDLELREAVEHVAEAE